jgi:hypothetical protein
VQALVWNVQLTKKYYHEHALLRQDSLNTTLLNLLHKLSEMKFALPLNDMTLAHPNYWNVLFSQPPSSNLSFSLSSSFNKPFTYIPQNSSPLSVSLSSPSQMSHSTALSLSLSSSSTISSIHSSLRQEESQREDPELSDRNFHHSSVVNEPLNHFQQNSNDNFATPLNEGTNCLKNEDQQPIATTMTNVKSNNDEVTKTTRIREQEIQKTSSILNKQQYSQESVEIGIVARQIQVVVQKLTDVS